MYRTRDDLIVPGELVGLLSDWRVTLRVDAAGASRCTLFAEVAPSERDRAGAADFSPYAFRYALRVQALTGGRAWTAGAGLDTDLADDLFRPDALEACALELPAGGRAAVTVALRLTLAPDAERTPRWTRAFVGRGEVPLTAGARVELGLGPVASLDGPPFDPTPVCDVEPLAVGPVLCPAPLPRGALYAAVPDAGALRVEPDGALRRITPAGELHTLSVAGLRRDERPVALVAGPRGGVALVCQTPGLSFTVALFDLARPERSVIARDVPVMPVDHWYARHAFDEVGRRFAYAHYPNLLGLLDLERGRAATFTGGPTRWAPLALGFDGTSPAALCDGELRALDEASGRWRSLGALPTLAAAHPTPRRAAQVTCHAQGGLGAPSSTVQWRDVGGDGGCVWVADALTTARVLADGLIVAFGRLAWVVDPPRGEVRRLGPYTTPTLFDGAVTRHGDGWRLWPAVPGAPSYIEFPGARS